MGDHIDGVPLHVSYLLCTHGYVSNMQCHCFKVSCIALALDDWAIGVNLVILDQGKGQHNISVLVSQPIPHFCTDPNTFKWVIVLNCWFKNDNLGTMACHVTH